MILKNRFGDPIDEIQLKGSEGLLGFVEMTPIVLPWDWTHDLSIASMTGSFNVNR